LWAGFFFFLSFFGVIFRQFPPEKKKISTIHRIFYWKKGPNSPNLEFF
jgi:hypothetical protein